MVWSSVWPDGTKSVKANTPTGNANTTYIETAMNVDHFWNIGVDQDGRHKQVQMPKQASDVTLGAGMDGAVYYKEVSASNSRVQGFYRNVDGIYQFIPSFKSGSVLVNSSGSYAIVTSVPAHSYGQIYMFTDNDVDNMQMGFFKSGAGVVQTYSSATIFSGDSSAKINLKFANGGAATGLNISVRLEEASSATYLYRIVYWGT